MRESEHCKSKYKKKKEFSYLNVEGKQLFTLSNYYSLRHNLWGAGFHGCECHF
jgi:hypothetical protein